MVFSSWSVTGLSGSLDCLGVDAWRGGMGLKVLSKLDTGISLDARSLIIPGAWRS